jgi:hypothetical protein
MTHLKIPNRVAENRIARAVLDRYDLRNSLKVALRHLLDDGELDRTLGCYRELMIQRDVTGDDLTRTTEANHRDSFYFSLLRNHFLVPHAEFNVIKVIHYPLLARQYLTASIARPKKRSCRSRIRGSRAADSYRMEVLSDQLSKCTRYG